MTGGASQAVLVKGAIDLRVRGQSARQHGDRIVAAIAVPRELDAFGADQDVDAGPVERRAERVGVQRLTPLVVGLFVAMAAILRLRKSAGLNELVALDGSIAGQRQVVLAETKIVGLPYLDRSNSCVSRLCRLRDWAWVVNCSAPDQQCNADQRNRRRRR